MRLIRIGGIEVYLDWSLLLIFLLVTTALGMGLFPQWHPDWGAAAVWTTATGAAILFFVSVLIHELSHAWVGRAQGVAISRITLFVFGGMAHIEEEPKTWRAELWMAIVGPFTSLALGAACVSLGLAVAGGVQFDTANPREALSGLSPVATLLLWLGPVNFLLGLFNLVPGFPLDGGRVLRAVLWGITGDLRLATRWASNGGRGFAWLLIFAGFAMVLGIRVPVFGTGTVNGLWLALIGWFLHNAAMMSYRQLVVRESLARVPVARLMHTRNESIAPTMPVSEFVDDHLLRSDQRSYPVLDGSRLVGLVSVKNLQQGSRKSREDIPVSRIMTPVDELVTIAPDADAFEVMETLERRGLDHAPVIDGGELRGLVGREDVSRWLSLHDDANGSQRR